MVVASGADAFDKASPALSAPGGQASPLQNQVCSDPLRDQSSTDFSPYSSPV